MSCVLESVDTNPSRGVGCDYCALGSAAGSSPNITPRQHGHAPPALGGHHPIHVRATLPEQVEQGVPARAGQDPNLMIGGLGGSGIVGELRD